MKNMLKALKDRQLENDQNPAEKISQTENDAACEISDADLASVNGAGDAMSWAKVNNQLEKH